MPDAQFRLTPAQEELRDRARVFAREVVAPGAAERDRDGTYPADVVARAANEGYLGLLIPEEFGGSAAGNLAQCVILEEIAWADASTHVTVSVHNSLVSAPLVAYGTPALKQSWLPRMARGEVIGAYALTEPHCGSDAAALTTSARRDGDDWVLSGTKMWITTGQSAGLMIVFARTDPDVHKTKGISAFAVPCDAPGFSAGKKEDKLGLRGSETTQVFLEDVRIPSDHLLGKENEGFKYAMHVLNGGRIGIATQAVGIARAALEACVGHLASRERDGKPVRAGQDEDFRLSEMATMIDAARLLTWRAAELRDDGLDHVMESSMAKLLASEACNAICRQAVALCGAGGWRSGSLPERLFRDARVTELYEGTTEVQKLVIARQLGGR